MAPEIRYTRWYPGGCPVRGCTLVKEPYMLDLLECMALN